MPDDHSGGLSVVLPRAHTIFREAVLQPEKSYTQYARPLEADHSKLPQIVAAVGVSIFVGIFAFGSYPKRELLPGHLIPEAGISNLYAPVSGQILELNVHEGSIVQPNDAIMTLYVQRENVNGATISMVIASIKKQIDDTQRINVMQIEAADNKIRDLTGLLEETSLQMQLAERDLARYVQLATKGFASVQSRDASMQAVSVLRGNVITIRGNLDQAKIDRLSLESRQEVDLSKLQQELYNYSAQDRVVIRAKLTGKISSINARVGTTVHADENMLTISPLDSPEVAYLYAPSRSIGQVTIGDEVNLRLNPYPYQQYGLQHGTVSEITQTTIPSSAIPYPIEGIESPTMPVYRITVKLDQQTINVNGRTTDLLSGTALYGDVTVDRRSIFNWTFGRAWYSVKGNM